MRILEYKSYREACERYTPNDRWEIFDGTRDNFNIAHECVDRHADKGICIKIAFSDASVQTITFRELSRYTSQFANAIEDLGIKKGDRIAIFVDQSLEFYVGLFGALKRGAVAVPCSTLFGSEAMEYRLKDSNAKMLIISRKHLKAFDTSMIENIIEVEDLINYIKDEKTSYKYKTNVYDLAILQYTSGTTRKPISIPYRHKSLVNLVPAAVFGYGIRLKDRYFCPSPVAWGHGIWAGTMAPLMFGVTAHVYSGKFNPSVF